MVFIEDNKIPVASMDKLILRFDAAAFICPQKILEGTKYHDRTLFVRFGILFINVNAVVMGILIGDKLPAFKIHMRYQIFPPR